MARCPLRASRNLTTGICGEATAHVTLSRHFALAALLSKTTNPKRTNESLQTNIHTMHSPCSHFSVHAWNGGSGLFPMPRRHLERGRRCPNLQLHALPKWHHHTAGWEPDFISSVHSVCAWVGRQPHLFNLPARLLLARRKCDVAPACCVPGVVRR